MNKMFLKKTAAEFEVAEETASGKVKGIAYSGEIIKAHGPFANLVIDLATTTVAKKKTPLLRDHDMSAIAGYADVTIADNKISLVGTLSTKTPHGIEIKELAQEGFDWEMSIGLFDFDIQEVSNEKVNGNLLEKGIVFRNGVLREVSLLSLGADMGTSVEVFNYKEGDNKMLTKEQWIKLACGCGGSDTSKPEDLKANFDAKDDMIEALKKELADLKKVLADKEQKDKEEQEVVDTKLRADQINAALEKKSVKFSVEKIAEASKSVEATEMLLSYVEGITVEAPKKEEKKISAEFAVKTEVGTPVKSSGDPVKDLMLAAEKLVKDGTAKDLMEAYDLIEEK